jgi:phosphatidylserine/phosphatidylglycerophosphate/cardiolipin synthase-like enzyme
MLDSSSGSSRGLQLANKGDEIVLADEYLFFDPGNEHQHIIDMVVYGNTTFITNFNSVSYPFNSTSQWFGKSVYNVSEGEILKRNRKQSPSDILDITAEFLDMDSAADWENYRVYHPGQSDFKFKSITYSGSATVFSSPDSAYEIISSELEKAKTTIYLSIYQFHNLYLMDKMINASARGVDVKVFIDGSPVGGLTDLGRFVASELVSADCEVRFIRSVSKENIHRRYNFVHTKYAVIDNVTTIVMSENWKTSGVPVYNTIGNRGWGIALRSNELAKDFADVFFLDWNPEMRDIHPFNSSHNKYGAPPDDFIPSWSVYGGDYKPRFESRTVNGEFQVTPVFAPDTTMDQYDSIIEMIGSAEKSVYIEQLNCYIDWDTKGREIRNLYLDAAIDAARRGCEVKILLDSAFANPDYAGLDNFDTVQYINAIAKEENLTGTLQAKLIYLDGYEGNNQLSLLHNKGIIVDGKITLISSINWATGSVIHNREAGVIIENAKIARFYTELFNYDWNLSVSELLKIYVLHSDTRDIKPGDSTEYVISIMNTQPIDMDVLLSLPRLEPGWQAELDKSSISLPSSDSVDSKPAEVRLTVIAPDQEFIDTYLKENDIEQLENRIKTLELGLVAEARGMAAEVVYTNTRLMAEADDSEQDKSKQNDQLDRSMFDPWLVLVLLAVMLIIGAVARDLIQARLKGKKKGEKESPDEVDEQEE